MVKCVVALSGAILAVVTVNVLLWVRAKRLQRDLSRMRVQRHLDWIITQAADGTAASTPEDRRRRFVVITGGVSGGIGTVVAAFAGRITASSWWSRSHPALATSTLTAAAALTALALMQINHIIAAPLTPAPVLTHSQVSHSPGARLRTPSASASTPSSPAYSGTRPPRPESPGASPQGLMVQDWPRQVGESSSALSSAGDSIPADDPASHPTPPVTTPPTVTTELTGSSSCRGLTLPRVHVGVCVTHSG